MCSHDSLMSLSLYTGISWDSFCLLGLFLSLGTPSLSWDSFSLLDSLSLIDFLSRCLAKQSLSSSPPSSMTQRASPLLPFALVSVPTDLELRPLPTLAAPPAPFLSRHITFLNPTHRKRESQRESQRESKSETRARAGERARERARERASKSERGQKKRK